MQIIEHMKNSKTHRDRKKIMAADGETKYTVSIRLTDERWVCSCPSFIFTCNKKGTDCKHIIEIKEMYGNDITEQDILQKLIALTKGKKDASKLAAGWLEIKVHVEMLHLYCKFTPGKEKAVKQIDAAMAFVHAGMSA